MNTLAPATKTTRNARRHVPREEKADRYIDAAVHRFEVALDTFLDEIARLEKCVERRDVELWLPTMEPFDASLSRALAALQGRGAIDNLLGFILAKLGELLPEGSELVPVQLIEARCGCAG
jgi:hypothetical protein